MNYVAICNCSLSVTDFSLFMIFNSFSPSPRLSQPQDATGRLPSSTVVTSLPSTNLPASTIITNLDDPPDQTPVAEEEAPLEAGELKLPTGLKLTMAPAGMVKLAAGPPDPPAQVLQLDVGPSLLASPNSLLPQVGIRIFVTAYRTWIDNS